MFNTLHISKLIAFLLSAIILLNYNCIAQNNDTIVIQAFSFDDSSPIGWNAQYKKEISFPDSVAIGDPSRLSS